MKRIITLEIDSENFHDKIVGVIVGYFKHFCMMAGAVAGKDFRAVIKVDDKVINQS